MLRLAILWTSGRLVEGVERACAHTRRSPAHSLSLAGAVARGVEYMYVTRAARASRERASGPIAREKLGCEITRPSFPSARAGGQTA